MRGRKQKQLTQPPVSYLRIFVFSLSTDYLDCGVVSSHLNYQVSELTHSSVSEVALQLGLTSVQRGEREKDDDKKAHLTAAWLL